MTPEYIQTQLSYSEALIYATAAKKFLNENVLTSELNKAMIHSLILSKKLKSNEKPDIDGFRSRYPNQFKTVMRNV